MTAAEKPDHEIKLLYEDPPDSEAKGIGIPAPDHPVTDPRQLDNNPGNQSYIAAILADNGAPEAATDFLHRWLGVELDDEGTLWVYYREDRNPTGHPWQA